MDNRRTNNNPVKGVCECSNNRDESSSGNCLETQTISTIKTVSTALAITESCISFLIAVVNKKIYLFVKFIDTC